MSTTPATPANPTPPATPAPKKSSWSKIKGFFSHVFSFFENDAAKFETSAATTISVALPLLNEMITLTAGSAIATKVSNVGHQVITDLQNTAAILNGAEAGSADHSVSGFLQDAVQALPTLLADADVKNSEHASTIEGVVTTVVGELQAILSALPANYTTPVVGAPATT
jgi:hypothetical protein